jgi:hypothetical protein
LLEDGDTRKRLSVLGRERAVNIYNWDIIAEQVESFYLEVLGR